MSPKAHNSVEAQAGHSLEDLEKRLREMPSFKTMERKLLELQISNLKNKIRAQAGIEPLKQEVKPELAKAALEEKKNADKVRTGTDMV